MFVFTCYFFFFFFSSSFCLVIFHHFIPHVARIRIENGNLIAQNLGPKHKFLHMPCIVEDYLPVATTTKQNKKSLESVQRQLTRQLIRSVRRSDRITTVGVTHQNSVIYICERIVAAALSCSPRYLFRIFETVVHR